MTSSVSRLYSYRPSVSSEGMPPAMSDVPGYGIASLAYRWLPWTRPSLRVPLRADQTSVSTMRPVCHTHRTRPGFRYRLPSLDCTTARDLKRHAASALLGLRNFCCRTRGPSRNAGTCECGPSPRATSPLAGASRDDAYSSSLRPMLVTNTDVERKTCPVHHQ